MCEVSLRHYRCYFLIDDKIKAVEDIAAEDDADALRQAEELLAGNSFPDIEIWQAERLVGRVSADPGLAGPYNGKASDSSPRHH